MINIYKLKLTILQQEIMRYLFVKAGESYNARALAMALDVSPPAVSKALPFLKKQNFIDISKDKVSNRFTIQLNRENKIVVGFKRVNNLRLLYESELVNFFYDMFPGATVICFGSYAHGEDTTTSDIDIAIIHHKEKALDLSSFEKQLERKIVINFYISFEKIEKPLLNNIINRITLKGAIDI